MMGNKRMNEKVRYWLELAEIAIIRERMRA